MFTLHAVQARFGDCLILQFGTEADPRYILIDGGPPDTFQNDLDTAMLQEVVKSKALDLVVASHIDNDHIVGLLDLFAALEENQANEEDPRVSAAGLWHNSFQRTLDPNGEIAQGLQTLMTMAGARSMAMPLSADAFFGVKEGNRLRILAKKLGVPINAGFPDDLVLLESANQPLRFGSLTVRVVGPTRDNLDKLRDEWLRWLEKAERQMSSAPEALANSDRSVPNLSSIVLLAECDGKTALLTGDARSDHILAGLKEAGLLTDGKVHVDLLKVPHHGSKAQRDGGILQVGDGRHLRHLGRRPVRQPRLRHAEVDRRARQERRPHDRDRRDERHDDDGSVQSGLPAGRQQLPPHREAGRGAPDRGEAVLTGIRHTTGFPPGAEVRLRTQARRTGVRGDKLSGTDQTLCRGVVKT